ncbi:TRAP transporter large permease [Sedimentibacter sp.]|uniref:TRAP transporter large permease n=1 Tax=Sedimentibacter sp. TaxID=1960295 RepID=UPI00289F6744|nr:TRAP transporter large permease [Sedimentibacter sp.]
MVSVLFIAFALFLLIGLPIAVAIGGSSFVFALLAEINPIVGLQKIVAGVDNTAFLAIPMFILAGDIMQAGNLSKRLINVANSFIGHINGGLAVVTVLTSMFFGAISGSAIATAASIGKIMHFEMVSRGYDESYSSALIAAASPLGMLVPPSILMVVIGVVSKTSIASLLIGGIGAAVVYALALIIYAVIIAKKRGYRGSEKASAKEKWNTFKEAIWALGAPVILLGGIFSGIFTPTEAAVVAVIYCMIIAIFVYKDVKFKDLPAIFLTSVKTTATLMFIVACASFFGYIIAYTQVSQHMVNFLINNISNPTLLLLTINLFLIILGCFMESMAIIIIVVPMILPLVSYMGLDYIHFGVMVLTNIAIGNITPPLGVCLYTVSGVTNLSIEKVVSGIKMPIIALVIALLIITFVPSVSTLLPQLMMK